jgi:Predicted membrane protein (DUF2243)/Cytochrome c oxidase caa3 assembly factor (Caa3_CtaG)
MPESSSLVVAGFFWFADLRRRRALAPRSAWAGAFLGLGGFHLFDGIVDHKLLGPHQIRYGVDILPTTWCGTAWPSCSAGRATQPGRGCSSCDGVARVTKAHVHGPTAHGAALGGIEWLPSVVLVAVLVAVYVAVVLRRGRAMGRRWSGWRTGAWVAGAVLLAAGISPLVADPARGDARGHMVQHLLLGCTSRWRWCWRHR